MFRTLFAPRGVTASAVLLVGGIGSAQQTWVVPTQFPSIQQAVNAASAGDTIEVLPGTYAEALSITKALTLRSVAGPLSTVIDGEYRTSVISVNGVPGATGVTIEGFTLRNGVASVPPFGGGVRCLQSTLRLRNNYVHSCLAINSGGGMHFDRSTVTVENNVLWDNEAVLFGGGIAVLDTDGDIDGNTIAWNMAGSAGGGGVDVEDGQKSGVALRNSILYGNTGGTTPDLQLFTVNATTVDYCDVGQGAPAGTGNVSVDPQFTAPEEGNFRLLGTSPVIDAGDPNSPLDPDGTVADMGAHFYSQSGCLDAENFCSPADNSSGGPARMVWDGSTSVSAADFVLGARSLPNGQSGLFIYSPDSGSTPLGDGLLCLGSQTLGFILRLTPNASDGQGVMRHALDFGAPPHPGGTITPGTTWYFQCWFRDIPAAQTGFNFSDGLRVVFCP